MVDLLGIPTLSYQGSKKGNKKQDEGILEGRGDVIAFKTVCPDT